MASLVIEKDIYGGDIRIRHDPFAKGRAPRYKVDGVPVKGTTTIMGKVLAKDLMGWAVSMAISYIRIKLPLITEEDLVIAEAAHTRARDSGASTGSEAHAMVENFLKDQSVGNDHTQEATNAYEAFVGWFGEVRPEVINVEEVIYSQHFGFAGTYDCMLRINGKVYLCDLKTTNASKQAPQGVYAENFIQLGAYALAHEEQRQYELAKGKSNNGVVGTTLEEIEGLMVISAKKDGKLDIVTNDDLGLNVKECGEMFARVFNLFQFLEYTSNKLKGGIK